MRSGHTQLFLAPIIGALNAHNIVNIGKVILFYGGWYAYVYLTLLFFLRRSSVIRRLFNVCVCGRNVVRQLSNSAGRSSGGMAFMV